MKVFDLHCDTLSELRRAEMRGDGQTFARNNGHIDLEKLEKGDYMLQCFAAFVNLADPTPGADPLVTALEEIDVFKRMMEQYSDRIAPVYRPEDIRRNAEAGKISGMLTIEEAGCCKGSLGVLRRMYELGVRMMTLTWNHENELASPNVVPGNGPIWPCMPNTETGLKVGDVVDFKGTQHYTSAAAKDAKTCKPGKATITAVAAGKAHPYHLKAISGGGSTVYGWVNAADISTGSTGTATSYRVRTTADVLNIRKGPGTNYGVAGQIKGKGIYTIVAEAAGPGATKWGKLKSGAGWISLDYVTKL